MHYGNIKPYDIADGPGVRVSLFVSGCRNACPGCFNMETWDFSFGKPYTEETTAEILEKMKPDWIQGFTLLGGEPFEEENQAVLAGVLETIRDAYPQKNIWCYTGYLWDVDLVPGGRKYTPYTDRMLSCIDTLVDGKFIEGLKDISLVFRGSSNQRILDLRAMRNDAR